MKNSSDDDSLLVGCGIVSVIVIVCLLLFIKVAASIAHWFWDYLIWCWG